MKKQKPRMGRIPIPRPGIAHKDRSKYDRKVKHKEEDKNVLRDIAALDCSADFSRRNFALATYVDDQGKARKMFNEALGCWRISDGPILGRLTI
jgi:hypothetical protein